MILMMMPTHTDDVNDEDESFCFGIKLNKNAIYRFCCFAIDVSETIL